LVKHNGGHNTKEDAFFIDSSAKNAAELNKGIRAHWLIENTFYLPNSKKSSTFIA
jgi:predicted transposase YbfD/YdcC